MADNVMGGIGQITGEIGEAVQEVASDVKDSIGEAIEQGVQAASTSPLTPQQQQQKQQSDHQKEGEVQGRLARIRQWFKNIQSDQYKVRSENTQKEQNRIHVQMQEQQAKKVEKAQMQGTNVPKPGQISEDIAVTRQEIGKGHGVGG